MANYLPDNLLETFWLLSWFFCFLCILIIIILLPFRFYYYRKDIRDENTSQFLQDLFIQYLSGSISEYKLMKQVKRRNFIVFATVLSKMLRSFDETSEIVLIKFIKNSKLDEWIIEQTKSKVFKKRLSAIQVLGHMDGDERYIGVLREIIEDNSDFRILFAATESLSMIGGEDNVLVIVKALEKIEDLSPLIIYDIFSNLSAVIYDYLYLISMSSQSPINMKIAALKAFGGINLFESQQILLHNCKNEHDELAASAYEALANIQMPLDQNYIIYGSKRENWRINYFTAKCARFASIFPREAFNNLLNNHNWMVTMEAAESIFSFGKEGIEFLLEHAKGDGKSSSRAQNFLNEHYISYGT